MPPKVRRLVAVGLVRIGASKWDARPVLKRLVEVLRGKKERKNLLSGKEIEVYLIPLE